MADLLLDRHQLVSEALMGIRELTTMRHDQLGEFSSLTSLLRDEEKHGHFSYHRPLLYEQ